MHSILRVFLCVFSATVAWHPLTFLCLYINYFTPLLNWKAKLLPFQKKKVEPAKRWSPNRDAGTKNCIFLHILHELWVLLTKEVSQDFLVNKVLPAIKAKWHAEEKGMPIYIQQDNAKTHIDVNDPAFVQAAQADGWDIRLTCQPPNSPDLNVLDLGFFLQRFRHCLKREHQTTLTTLWQRLIRRIRTILCKGPTVFF